MFFSKKEDLFKFLFKLEKIEKKLEEIQKNQFEIVKLIQNIGYQRRSKDYYNFKIHKN
ncbi:MAG: hypothetical protein HYU63_02295 [Armatimonadetes bacterium]|nr:hypothetical protein [Armatimonadota bacterium]